MPQRRQTLLESAHDVGGISVFIYLFAKVGSAPVYEFGYFRFPKKTLLTASHLVSLWNRGFGQLRSGLYGHPRVEELSTRWIKVDSCRFLIEKGKITLDPFFVVVVSSWCPFEENMKNVSDEESALRVKCAYFVVSWVVNWYLFSCRSWKWQKTKRPKLMHCQLFCRYSTSLPFMLELWLKSLGLHCSKGSCCRRSARLATILSRYFHGVFIINCLSFHWKGTNIQSHFLFLFVQGEPAPHVSPSLPVQAPSSPSFSLYFLPILQPVAWQKKKLNQILVYSSQTRCWWKRLVVATYSNPQILPTIQSCWILTPRL